MFVYAAILAHAEGELVYFVFQLNTQHTQPDRLKLSFRDSARMTGLTRKDKSQSLFPSSVTSGSVGEEQNIRDEALISANNWQSRNLSRASSTCRWTSASRALGLKTSKAWVEAAETGFRQPASRSGVLGIRSGIDK